MSWKLTSVIVPSSDSTSIAKQERQADHIEEDYKKQGVSEKEAERRAWTTVNKSSGGGKKSGSGRGKAENKAPSKKGGKKGASAQSHATRVKAGKKAAIKIRRLLNEARG